MSWNDYESQSWKGIPVKDKDGRQGVVIADDNGPFHRYLDVRFEDGEVHTLKLNNTRQNPYDPLQIQWEYNPGKWAVISS